MRREEGGKAMLFEVGQFGGQSHGGRKPRGGEGDFKERMKKPKV